MTALVWRILGLTSVGIGLINAFIPLMPTTVFLLIGAWALGKGSPEWRAKLIAHPRFGRALRDWEDSEAAYAASSAQARADHDREVNAATAERASQYMAEQRSLDAARESYLYPCRGSR